MRLLSSSGFRRLSLWYVLRTWDLDGGRRIMKSLYLKMFIVMLGLG